MVVWSLSETTGAATLRSPSAASTIIQPGTVSIPITSLPPPAPSALSSQSNIGSLVSTPLKYTTAMFMPEDTVAPP